MKIAYSLASLPIAVRHVTLTLLVATLTVTSGCSLINPHISIPPPALIEKPANTDIYGNPLCTNGAAPVLKDGKEVCNDGKAIPKIEFYGDLPRYFDYANEMRDKYYAAVGHQSLLRNGTALTLIPLAATALYLGIIGDAGTNTMAALGVGGAAIYGTSSYLQSAPRQRVYLAGADAVGCAVLRTIPWLVTKDEHKAFAKALKEIPAASETARAAIAGLKATVGALKGAGRVAPLLNSANALATNSDIEWQKSTMTRKQGIALAGELDTAHIVLYHHLMRIRNDVSRQVQKTEPSLNEILRIIGGLATSSAAFAPRPILPSSVGATAQSGAAIAQSGGTNPKTLSSDERNELVRQTRAVESAMATLAEKTASVSFLIERVNDAKTRYKNINDCNLAEIDFGLELSPDALFFLQDVNATATVQAKYGKGPFEAQVVGHPATDKSSITVTTPNNWGTVLTVTAKKPQAGIYSLQVKDANNNVSEAIITVTAEPLPVPPEVGAGCGGTNRKTIGNQKPDADGKKYELCASRDKGRNIQKALCLDQVDGVFGRGTRLAICQWRKDNGGSCANVQAAPGLSEKEANDILANGAACKADRKTWFESNMDDGTDYSKWKTVLARVGVNVSGFDALSDSAKETKVQTWLKDTAVRAMIKKFSEDNKAMVDAVQYKDASGNVAKTREWVTAKLLAQALVVPTSAQVTAAQTALCVATPNGTATDPATVAAVKQLHKDSTVGGTPIGSVTGELTWDVINAVGTSACKADRKSWYENNVKDAVIKPVLGKVLGLTDATAINNLDVTAEFAKPTLRGQIKAFKNTTAIKSKLGIDLNSNLITRALINAAR